MGEYAEMMLDGTCCEGCGEYMGQGDGFPRYCSKDCEPAECRDVADKFFPRSRARLRLTAADNGFDDLLCDLSQGSNTRCPICNKRCKGQRAVDQHVIAKHTNCACPHCSKICKSEAGVRDHIAAKHPNQKGDAP